MNQLDGRVAVVTGAASGLGAALARTLAHAKMRVVVADIQLEGAEAVRAELEAEGSEARAFRVDVGNPHSLEELARSAEQAFGGCDLLCANVGVQQFGRADTLSHEEWSWVMGVNVLGTVATVRAFLPQIRARGDGHVLITASTSSLYAAPRLAAYTASKYAVMGFAETLRMELASEEIGVSLLLPGPMATTHLQSSAAAKPVALEGPIFKPEDLELVASAMADDPMVSPDHAVRNVVEDVLANQPYIVTHDVQRAPIERRMEEIWRAFDRAQS